MGLAENRECADCTAAAPQWASWNLGVFICERCVGVHRQLGTHISMPRSCTIDDWNAEQLSAMKAVGNLNAQCYWEYNVPFGEQKPESTDPMAFVAHWIKRKYESQEFLRRPGGPEQNAPLDPGVRAYERKGYLLKEGGGSGKGRWQQRFFLLRDFKLEYYDKEPSNAGEKVRPELPPAPALYFAQTHAGSPREFCGAERAEGNHPHHTDHAGLDLGRPLHVSGCDPGWCRVRGDEQRRAHVPDPGRDDRRDLRMGEVHPRRAGLLVQ